MSPVEGDINVNKRLKFVLVKLRKSGQNVFCCSCCTAQTQVSVGTILGVEYNAQ